MNAAPLKQQKSKPTNTKYHIREYKVTDIYFYFSIECTYLETTSTGGQRISSKEPRVQRREMLFCRERRGCFKTLKKLAKTQSYKKANCILMADWASFNCVVINTTITTTTTITITTSCNLTKVKREEKRRTNY